MGSVSAPALQAHGNHATLSASVLRPASYPGGSLPFSLCSRCSDVRGVLVCLDTTRCIGGIRAMGSTNIFGPACNAKQINAAHRNLRSPRYVAVDGCPPPVHRQRDGGRVVRKGARMQAVYTACCKPWTTSLTAGRRVATRTWSAFHDIGGVFRLPLSPAVSSDGSTATVGYFAGQRSAAWHAVWATVAFHVEWHGLVFADVRNLLRLRFVRSGTAPQSAPVALGIGSSLSFHPCSTGLLSTTLLFCYK